MSLGVESAEFHAVAQHGDALGDLQHLVEAMADKHHADARRFSSRDSAEQRVDLVAGQRGRRLVHDDELGVGRDGAADRDELPLGDRQLRHRLVEVERPRRCAPWRPCAVARTAGQLTGRCSAAMPADGDVLGDGEVREQRQVLIDHLDAESAALDRRQANVLAALDTMRPPGSGPARLR